MQVAVGRLLRLLAQETALDRPGHGALYGERGYGVGEPLGAPHDDAGDLEAEWSGGRAMTFEQAA